MINVGEQLVSSYLRYLQACEFTQMNLYTVESQGEIDVVGINLKEKKVYICEVAVHLTTGLQYTKNKRPNNIQKLTDKFSRDIDYANKYFADYDKHFMLWSPVVKSRKDDSLYNQLGHLSAINSNLKASHGVNIEFVLNDIFLECLREMRQYARSVSADIKCPVMRLFQIEEQLARHLKVTGFG